MGNYKAGNCKKVINLIKMTAVGNQKKETYIEMVLRAIPDIKDRKGASRTTIANWIQANFNKEAGSSFNAFLRNALKKGIESGVLKEGTTSQRYRIGQLPKPKKAAKKKKIASKKKKVSSKKKVSKKKKSAVSKKKSS